MRSPATCPSSGRKFASAFVLALFALYAVWPVARFFLAPQVNATNATEAAASAFSANSFGDPAFLRWLGNSALVAATVALAGTAAASVCGYALSRKRAGGLVLPQLLPAAAVVLPLCLLLFKMQLAAWFVWLAVIYAATALPFCVWKLKRCYDAIPLALEEAATLDGCPPGLRFRAILLPLAAPGILAAALFSFAIAWNESIVAALLLRGSGPFPLPPGLVSSGAIPAVQWAVCAAGAFVLAAPTAGLLLLLGRPGATRRADDPATA